MKRVLRTLFSIVALLLLVGVVAIGSLVYFIDPNKMRPVLVEEVMNRTGYQLAIYGKLNWTVYPVVGLKVQRMTLTAPDQMEPFIDLNGITIASTIPQILHGNKSLEGDVRISDVKLMNVHAQNAHVTLQWQKSVLTLSPLTANLYDGELQGVAHGSQLADVPRWDWDVKLDHVQVQPLLRDANRGEARMNLSGVGDVAINASTRGLTREQMISNLNGQMNVTLQDGRVSGIDLNYLVKSADDLINKKSVDVPSDNLTETKFDRFSGSITIKNGVAETNNLVLIAPGFITHAQGTINLLYQAVNFALQVKPEQDNQVKWEVPVLLTGNLNNPDVKIDLAEVQKFLAKTEVDKVKEKVRNEISKRVPGETGEMLQKFLGS